MAPKVPGSRLDSPEPGAPTARQAPRLLLIVMSSDTPPAADLHLVVGYDGSPPASRALDAAVGLLSGRAGRITVVYVAHMPGLDALSPGALGEMETSFDEIALDLRGTAAGRLDGHADWDFERHDGLIPDELLAAARSIHAGHPDDTVVIVVGSSSHAV